MRKKIKLEISPENQAAIEKMADLLGQVDDLLQQLVDAEDDSYTRLLNLIHNRIPESYLLERLIMDADDSEMRCPK